MFGLPETGLAIIPGFVHLHSTEDIMNTTIPQVNMNIVPGCVLLTVFGIVCVQPSCSNGNLGSSSQFASYMSLTTSFVRSS